MILSIHALQKSFSSYRTLLTAENILIVVYFCLGLIGILHHEMWRDEMQSWLIARDSHSLTELFENTQHEGHPILWHLCLYGLVQFTHNPLIMQIFHLLIATGVVVLFVKFSPFNTFNRFIFPFGYFAFYEYSIISRNYSLGVFLLFLFCVLYSRSKENYITLGIILALLANVNAFVLIVSFIISLALLIQAFYDYKQCPNVAENKHRNLAIGATIAALGWVASVIQIGRVADEVRVLQTANTVTAEAAPESSVTQMFFEEAKKLILESTSIWRSYVPIPDSLEHFWNSNFLIDTRIDNNTFQIAGAEVGKVLALALTLLIIIASLWLLSNHFLSLFIYAGSTLGIILFNYSALVPELRHHGHLFILFIVGLWLANDHQRINNSLTQQQNSTQLRWRNQWLSLFLCLQLVAGIHIYSMDLLRPFSVMKSAADYIQSQGLQDQFILGYRYRQASVLAGYLDRKIFYPENQQLGSFWSIQEKEIGGEKKLLSIVQKVRRQNNTDLVLVLTRPIKPLVELNIVELVRFTGAIEDSENAVYLYLAHNPVVSQKADVLHTHFQI